MLRLLALATFAALSAASASAQTACSGGTASDAAGTAFACDAVDLMARLTPQALGAPAFEDCPQRACLNDLWGWTDAETGREYALVGMANGTAFVDITDPAAPLRLGVLPTATNRSTWRDVKTYGSYAYVVAEAGGHGLQVFDLRRLRGLAPDAGRFFTADATVSDFGRTHNVVVDEAGARVIAVGGACGSGLQIYSLADPAAPAFAGCSGETGYLHDAQCLVYDGPDPDHLGRNICLGFNGGAVYVIDATDPAAATLLATGFYPGAAYAHQGWLTEDRRHLLVNDEADEGFTTDRTRTLIFDVSDLDDPEYVGAYLNPMTETVDHNLYVRGGYVYQANYNNGLRILDLAGVATAELDEVAFFDTFAGSPDGFQDDFDGAWSVYPFFESGAVIVSDQIYGLFVLRPDASVVVADEAAAPTPEGLALAVETPARDAAAVALTAPAGEPVRLALYDVRGRALGVLFDGPGTGARQTFRLDASTFAAGVVVVRAETAAGAVTRRATFVR